MRSWNYIQSPFDPRSISGCILWLDAADATTITLNSGNVSQWNDKSGNASNFSQSTAINQPAYTLAGRNGRNVLTFTGAHLTGQYLTGTTVGSFQPITVFTAVNIQGNDATNASDYLTDAGPIGDRFAHALNFSGSNQNEMFLYTGGAVAVDITINKTNWQGWHEYTAIYNTSATSSLSQDGTSLGGTTGMGASVLSDLTIASRFSIEAFLNGDLGEMIIYTGIPSSGDRELVTTYLKAKWAV